MKDLSTFSDELYRQTVGFCPPGCRVYKLATRPGFLPSIDAALEAVNNHGAASALLHRAHKQHAAHSHQADDRFFDVLTEAIAFAYASGQFPAEQFVFTDDIGKHDIESANFAIEAKSIHGPVDRIDEPFASGVSHPGLGEYLMKKLFDKLDRAASQTAGRMRQQLIVLNVLKFEDLESDIAHEDKMLGLQNAAALWIRGHPELSEVVLIWNFEWLSPKVVRYLAA